MGPSHYMAPSTAILGCDLFPMDRLVLKWPVDENLMLGVMFRLSKMSISMMQDGI